MSVLQRIGISRLVAGLLLLIAIGWWVFTGDGGPAVEDVPAVNAEGTVQVQTGDGNQVSGGDNSTVNIGSGNAAPDGGND